MARKIKLFVDENRIFEISIKKFAKEDLYGTKRTIKLDSSSEGNLLQTLSISSEGAHIITKGALSSQYIDQKENYIKREAIIQTDKKGKELKITPSTFETGIYFTEINIQEYFNYDIETTYAITENPDHRDHDEQLFQFVKQALDQDILYKFTFAYRATKHPSEGILLPIDSHVIIAVGTRAPEVWSESTMDMLELKKQVEHEDISFEGW